MVDVDFKNISHAIGASIHVICNVSVETTDYTDCLSPFTGWAT